MFVVSKICLTRTFFCIVHITREKVLFILIMNFIKTEFVSMRVHCNSNMKTLTMQQGVLIITNNYGQSHLRLQLKYNVKQKKEVRLDISFWQTNQATAFYASLKKLI